MTEKITAYDYIQELRELYEEIEEEIGSEEEMTRLADVVEKYQPSFERLIQELGKMYPELPAYFEALEKIAKKGSDWLDRYHNLAERLLEGNK